MMRSDPRPDETSPTFVITLVEPADGKAMEIRAGSWIEALEAGSSRLGSEWDRANSTCEIASDASIRVTDLSSGWVYRVQPGSADTLIRDDANATVVFAESPQVTRNEAGPLEQRTRYEEPNARPPVRLDDLSGKPSPTNPGLKLMRPVWEGVARIVGSALTAEQTLDAALTLSFDTVPCRTAQVLIPLPRAGQYRVLACLGETGADLRGSLLWLSKDMQALLEHTVGTVRRRGLDTTLVFREREGPKRNFDVDSVIWGPIRQRDRVLAVLALFDAEEGRGFAEAEVHAIQHVCAKLAEPLSKHL